jgi:N-formylglutamate deformylase
MNPVFSLHQGSSPLLVSLPHAGTKIPTEMQHLYTSKALLVEDTDWHLDQLYNFVTEQGISLITPKFSRYVIDLNRPPEDTAMYAGVNNTGLCPLTDFEGVSIYKDGGQPNAQDILQRKQQYWQPYHAALANELARLKSMHGFAVLLDGHSIKSQLPWLFDGKLPDLNVGTVNGSSCSGEIGTAVAQLLDQERDFSNVMNGRFKGGYITRHYGQPSQNIHAVQLEMCWSTYMQEQAPYVIDESRRPKITAFLQKFTLLLSKGTSQKESDA